MNDLVNDDALVKLERLKHAVRRISDEIGNTVILCDKNDLPGGVEEAKNQAAMSRMPDLVQHLNPKRPLKSGVTLAEAAKRPAGGRARQTTLVRRRAFDVDGNLGASFLGSR